MEARENRGDLFERYSRAQLIQGFGNRQDCAGSPLPPGDLDPDRLAPFTIGRQSVTVAKIAPINSAAGRDCAEGFG